MYNDDEIVVLETANGEEIEFILLGEVTIDKYDYVILKPVILLDGMADDEAIAFKVSTNADGSESFNVVEDEKLMDKIFDKYNALLEKELAKLGK